MYGDVALKVCKGLPSHVWTLTLTRFPVRPDTVKGIFRPEHCRNRSPCNDPGVRIKNRRGATGGASWRRRRRAATACRAIEPVHLVGSACGRNANGLHSPKWGTSQSRRPGSARLQGCSTAQCGRSNPTRRSERKSCCAWISTQYVPAVRTAGLAKLTVKVLPFCVNGWLVVLKTCVPGRPPLVGVKEDVKTGGGSRTIEVHPIGIDGLHIPSLTSGHHKVVGEIGVEGREVGERRGKVAAVRSVVVLIV